MLSVRVYYNFHQTCKKSDYCVTRLQANTPFEREQLYKEIKSVLFFREENKFSRENVCFFTRSLLRKKQIQSSLFSRNDSPRCAAESVLF
jgi:hypothetical protein